MDKTEIQDLLEICEQMGTFVDPAKGKRQLLEPLQYEEVSFEEAGRASKRIYEKKERDQREI